MTRTQLAHILRAAARIAGDPNVHVVGSQSILGSFADEDLPDAAIGSIEVDLYFSDDPDEAKVTAVDIAIGEETHFHEAFRIYAQGVSEETSTLPAGWEARRIVWTDPACEGARAICLEPHDLCAAKLAAGREKDVEFVAALLRERLVEWEVLIQRVDALPVPQLHRRRIRTLLETLR